MNARINPFSPGAGSPPPELAGRMPVLDYAAPTHDALIRKGMIFSPVYGETAFTVPLFDEFMHRIMPEFL